MSFRLSTAPLCSAGKRGDLCQGCPGIRGDIPAPCKTCGSAGSWRMQKGWQGGLSALSSMFPRKPSTANITLVLPCGPAHVMSRTISHNSAQKVSKTWWNVQWLWHGFPAGKKTRDWGCLHCFGALWQIPNQTFYYFYSNLMVYFPHSLPGLQSRPVAVFILKELHLTKERKEKWKNQQSHRKPWNA